MLKSVISASFLQLSTFVPKAYKQLSIFHSIFQDILTRWSKTHEEKKPMVKKLKTIERSTRELKKYLRSLVREHYCQWKYPFIVFTAHTVNLKIIWRTINYESPDRQLEKIGRTRIRQTGLRWTEIERQAQGREQWKKTVDYLSST